MIVRVWPDCRSGCPQLSSQQGDRHDRLRRREQTSTVDQRAFWADIGFQPRCGGMTGSCAEPTAGVDVQRALRIAALDASNGRRACLQGSSPEGLESAPRPSFRSGLGVHILGAKLAQAQAGGGRCGLPRHVGNMLCHADETKSG